MEKIKNIYECLFIADVTGGEEATKATVEKFVNLITANSETVIEVAQWGRRSLAYAINDKPEGYYVVCTFKCDPAFPAELERLFNIDENIMRSLTLRLEHEPAPKAAAPVVEEATEEVVVEEAPVAEVTADNE
jgi:small subunit ribosomal protein S6